eukprot:1150213-Prymnesium_polylepis.1
MRLVCVSHPPTRGYVPACPDGTPCLPACPVVSHVFSRPLRSGARADSTVRWSCTLGGLDA